MPALAVIVMADKAVGHVKERRLLAILGVHREPHQRDGLRRRQQLPEGGLVEREMVDLDVAVLGAVAVLDVLARDEPRLDRVEVVSQLLEDLRTEHVRHDREPLPTAASS